MFCFSVTNSLDATVHGQFSLDLSHQGNRGSSLSMPKSSREDQAVPSIYRTWYYTTLLGQHRLRECQLFRDWESSLPLRLFIVRDGATLYFI